MGQRLAGCRGRHRAGSATAAALDRARRSRGGAVFGLGRSGRRLGGVMARPGDAGRPADRWGVAERVQARTPSDGERLPGASHAGAQRLWFLDALVNADGPERRPERQSGPRALRRGRTGLHQVAARPRPEGSRTGRCPFPVATPRLATGSSEPGQGQRFWGSTKVGWARWQTTRTAGWNRSSNCWHSSGLRSSQCARRAPTGGTMANPTSDREGGAGVLAAMIAGGSCGLHGNCRWTHGGLMRYWTSGSHGDATLGAPLACTPAGAASLTRVGLWPTRPARSVRSGCDARTRGGDFRDRALRPRICRPIHRFRSFGQVKKRLQPANGRSRQDSAKSQSPEQTPALVERGRLRLPVLVPCMHGVAGAILRP